MMIRNSSAAMMRIRITSASTATMITNANVMGIILFNVQYIDELTVTVEIYRRDFIAFRRILDKRGDHYKVERTEGLYWFLKGMLVRPVLLAGVFCFLILTMYLPSRVLFIKVSGNIDVPTQQILEEAGKCGLTFGSSRAGIRSEKIKNELLARIPDLQWAGVNTKGCVAVISVKERSISKDKVRDDLIANIYASRDGIIKECTILRGNSLCRVGQAVKAGQLLVSGYIDCGKAVIATKAEAEIYAVTSHVLEMTTLPERQVRREIIGQKKRYSFIFGKKLINFYKDSGISDVGCVKMTKERFITFPGGFTLPFGYMVEEYSYYRIESLETENYGWMQDACRTYIGKKMIAGEILSENYYTNESVQMYSVQAQFSCLEMIGQVRSEEIINRNGEINGKNHKCR